MKVLLISLLLLFVSEKCQGKYVEGHIKTHEVSYSSTLFHDISIYSCTLLCS